MKIAITAQGKELDSPFDMRFGRCANFIIYDTDTDTYESFENPFQMAASGAGIQAAQFVASKGVSVVISGEFGPKASEVLSAAGIRMFTTSAGTVREAIDRFRKGEGAEFQGYAGYAPYYAPPYAYPPPYPAPWFWGIPPEYEISMLKNMKSFLEWQISLIEERLRQLGER